MLNCKTRLYFGYVLLLFIELVCACLLTLISVRFQYPLLRDTEVQDVPTDLVAAGYAALCDFFNGQSDKDPRLDPSFCRKKQDPQPKVKSTTRKPRKRLAGDSAPVRETKKIHGCNV